MTERFIKEHDEVLEELLRVNEDLSERMRTLSYRVFYDREDDSFTLTIGEPQEALTESSNNEMYLRYDADTLKIVGIEVPHASKRLFDNRFLSDLMRSIPATVRDAVGA
jgi:hypothetical protein